MSKVFEFIKSESAAKMAACYDSKRSIESTLRRIERIDTLISIDVKKREAFVESIYDGLNEMMKEAEVLDDISPYGPIVVKDNSTSTIYSTVRILNNKFNTYPNKEFVVFVSKDIEHILVYMKEKFKDNKELLKQIEPLSKQFEDLKNDGEIDSYSLVYYEKE